MASESIASAVADAAHASVDAPPKRASEPIAVSAARRSVDRVDRGSASPMPRFLATALLSEPSSPLRDDARETQAMLARLRDPSSENVPQRLAAGRAYLATLQFRERRLHERIHGSLMSESAYDEAIRRRDAVASDLRDVRAALAERAPSDELDERHDGRFLPRKPTRT